MKWNVGRCADLTSTKGGQADEGSLAATSTSSSSAVEVEDIYGEK